MAQGVVLLHSFRTEQALSLLLKSFSNYPVLILATNYRAELSFKGTQHQLCLHSHMILKQIVVVRVHIPRYD